MNSTNKTKTSIAKFEEFFSTIYKDDVFEILEKYPDERSLIINYEDLWLFDSDLADLLIERPEEVILASQKAITNIDPLMKDAELNIRFKNIPNNIPLLEVSSRHIGTLISTEGIIKAKYKVHPRIATGVFECRGCMRLHEVEQPYGNNLLVPSLCSECGNRSFKLLEEESKYIDNQKFILTNFRQELGVRDEPVNLKLILEDDMVNRLIVDDSVRVTGILKTYRNNEGKFEKYLYVNYIDYIDTYDETLFADEKSEDENTASRTSAEYTRWRRNVLKRDKVCQCCGLDKRLQAHHIYGYEENPELAYKESNGIILCQFCHDKYHSVYGIKDINPVKFAKFMRRFSNGKME